MNRQQTTDGRRQMLIRGFCRLSSVICCLAFPMAAPVAALAEEAPQKGMPQLDFANPLTISQIVWLAVIFVALYVILSAWALPKVGSVLTDRATRIATDLESARAAKEAADHAVREARAAIARSRAEAQAAVNDAVERAKAEAAASNAALGAALDAKLTAAEQDIAAARAAAFSRLGEVATQAASTMIERLSGKHPTAQTVANAVTALLAQRAA